MVSIALTARILYKPQTIDTHVNSEQELGKLVLIRKIEVFLNVQTFWDGQILVARTPP